MVLAKGRGQGGYGEMLVKGYKVAVVMQDE